MKSIETITQLSKTIAESTYPPDGTLYRQLEIVMYEIKLLDGLENELNGNPSYAYDKKIFDKFRSILNARAYQLWTICNNEGISNPISNQKSP